MLNPFRALNSTQLERLSLTVIFSIFILQFWPTFVGPTRLLTGDQEHWFGLANVFMNGFYNGFISLWNPYNQGGEPLFPLFGLFRLMDPLFLILIFIGKVLNLPIFNLYHFQFVLRSAICLFGFYLLFKQLNRTGKNALLVNLILLLLMMLFVAWGMVDALYATICWIPYILWFLLRFFERESFTDFLLAIYLIGIYVGAGSYQIATGTFFLFCFLLSFFILWRHTFVSRLKYLYKKRRWSTLLSFVFLGLMTTPTLASFATLQAETVPIARISLHRDTFVNQGSYEFSYDNLMREGESLNLELMYEVVTRATALRLGFVRLPMLPVYVLLIVLGLMLSDNRWKYAFLALLLIFFFFLMGANTPLHRFMVALFAPLKHVRVVRSGEGFFVLSFIFLAGLGLQQLLESPRLNGKRVLRFFPYVLCGLLLFSLTGKKMTPLETPELYIPDFAYRSEKVEFIPRRIFALPRTNIYLMESGLYKKITALTMLAAPPADLDPVKAPYFLEWSKFKAPRRADPVYGLRSLIWTKNYYQIYLMGEHDIDVFNSLTGC